MANTAGLCSSFKVDILNGKHAFSAAYRAADTFNGALYLASATLSPSTTVYSSTGEVANSGTYAAGGSAITNATAPTNGGGTTAYWTPSGNLTWTSFTASAFDTLFIYNATQANSAVGVFTFSSQSVTAGTFTLTMPTNNNSTGLIRIA